MDKVILAVAAVAAVVALAGGAGLYAAAANGVIWGGLVWVLLWARAKWLARRERRLGG